MFARKPDGNAEERIFAADSLTVLFFHADREARVLRRAGLGGHFYLLEQNRRIALEIALDISGLVAMAAKAPDKDAEAVEVPGLFAVGSGGPQPDVLLFVVVLNQAEREIANDALTLGVLRDIVGNGHGDEAREHPTGLSGGGADEAPAIGAWGEFLRWELFGIGFVALALGKFQPIGGGTGGFGMGGGGTFADLASFFGSALSFFEEGGIKGLRGVSERGRTMDCSTSNFSFSLSCRKLGEERTGWV